MKALYKPTNVPWLGVAVLAVAASVAAVSAGLLEASAFVPALIVTAAFARRRSR